MYVACLFGILFEGMNVSNKKYILEKEVINMEKKKILIGKILVLAILRQTRDL